MATYSFTISNADKTAIASSTFLNTVDHATNGVIEIVADRGFARQTKFRVLTAKFGDGYEQRVRDGINNRQDMFTLSFKNRTSEEIHLIAAYLDYKRGLNFSLVISDDVSTGAITTTTYKVVCEDYNISYTNNELQSLTTKFRRVYEP